MRKDNSGENLAVIRHIALNLYKSYTKVKLSMKANAFATARKKLCKKNKNGSPW